eukprot:174660-Rhodomonas_salina.1
MSGQYCQACGTSPMSHGSLIALVAGVSLVICVVVMEWPTIKTFCGRDNNKAVTAGVARPVGVLE